MTKDDRAERLPSIPGYTLTRRIGSGRFASVYCAVQNSLVRSVAIKVLQSDSQEFHERFDREAEIMARLSHPHLVHVIDRGALDHQHYIVMEYMDGGSLREQLVPGQPADLASVRRISSAVSEGLKCLHSQRILHRDVKPDNILFSRDGAIKVSDFGISVPIGQLGQLTNSDASPGTADYMAPEQRYSLDVNEAADQYSLAVVCYEMLTGRLPPRVFRPVSERNPAVNSEVDRVLQRAFREDPDARFGSIHEFAEQMDLALSASIGNESVGAEVRSDSIAGKRSSSLPSALLVFLACLITGVGVWLIQWGVGPRADHGSSGQPGSATNDRIVQTGALIYRDADDGITELMIVMARSKSHWTIPKANQTPDLTPGGVAEEEALEEAGIRGESDEVSIGSYRYSRGERSYVVNVVPVRATEQLDDWPESFRDRKWCSVSEAAQLVTADKLRELILAFDPSGAKP